MSIQQDAWTQFKTQVGGDTTLLAYVKKFKFNRQEEIFKKADFPLLVAFPVRTTEEEPIGIPKQRLVKLRINVFAKVCHPSGDTIESELLKFDEYVKNAIEKDVLLAYKTINVFIGDSEFSYLDKEYAESNFTVDLYLPRFTAGSR